MPGVDLGINLDSIADGLVVGSGGTTSPAWANNVRTIVQTIIDDIEAKIVPGEINVNASVEFNANRAIEMGGIQFQDLATQPTTGSDNGLLYEFDGNLYFNDSNGNDVRLTFNGAVDITSTGQITGMTGAAAVSYTGGGSDEYAFVDHNGYPAGMDHGPIQLKEQATGITNAVTLGSPGSLASSYAWTYPTALPSSGTELVNVTSAGQLDTTADPSVTTITASGVASLNGGAQFRASGNGNETLDHFQDNGTYTPTFWVANSSVALSTRQGSYCRIGSWVFVSITLDDDSENLAAGLFQVSLPYDADFTSQNSYSGVIGQCRVGSNNYDDASCIIDFQASNDPDGRINIYETKGAALNAAFSDTPNGVMRLRLSIAYQTDAPAD